MQQFVINTGTTFYLLFGGNNLDLPLGSKFYFNLWAWWALLQIYYLVFSGYLFDEELDRAIEGVFYESVTTGKPDYYLQVKVYFFNGINFFFCF